MLKIDGMNQVGGIFIKFFSVANAVELKPVDNVTRI